MNRTVGNVITLIVAIVIILAVLEIAFRLFAPQQLNPYTYDSDYIFKFSPGAELRYVSPDYDVVSKFNSHGFRDREYDKRKEEGDYRVIVLGDSFTAAIEVPLEKGYVKVAEKQLREKTPEIKLLSVAVNGWSTEQQLMFMEKEGVGFDPDLVVLAYYVGNDQIDNVEREIFSYGDELEVNQKRKLSYRWPRRYYYALTGNWHVFTFFWNTYLRIKDTQATPSGELYEQEFLEYLAAGEPEKVAYAWDKTFALLDRMHDMLESKDIPLIILLIPHEIQERPDELENVSVTKPQETLKEYAEEREIPVIDILPAFENKEGLHFETDFHWNEAGHAVAAEELADGITNFINPPQAIVVNGEQ